MQQFCRTDALMKFEVVAMCKLLADDDFYMLQWQAQQPRAYLLLPSSLQGVSLTASMAI